MLRFLAIFYVAITLGSTVQAAPPSGRTIHASGPQGLLAGTLLGAGNKGAPVALIIPGSGPTDRDGNNPLGVRAASYRLLAEGLWAAGIASARIDKRGMFGSSAAIPDANAVTIGDYVHDTASWVDVIRRETGAPCVWLIGHSEGGLVALAAAEKVEGLCGLVLIATAGRPFGEILKTQLRANPANAPLLPAAEQIIDQLGSGLKVSTHAVPQPLLPLFHPVVQDFLISVMALDPASLAKGTSLPVLIVQGGKDLQVSLKDAELLKEALPSAKLTILPNANHVLKDITSEDTAENLAAYAAIDLPLADGLIASISAFMARPSVR